MKRILTNKGFTLVEMLVVMAVFVVIIAIAGESFNSILKFSAKLVKSEESNIEGIVGLEMMRHDIQQAGFGLFTDTSPVAYTAETENTPESDYNDGTFGPPRAIVTAQVTTADTVNADDNGTAVALDRIIGTDYLVVKATSVGRNAAAQKWTYLRFSSPKVSPNVWNSNAENFASGDKVVLLRRNVTKTDSTATLVRDTAGSAAQSYYFAYSDTAFAAFSSANASMMSAYGVNTSAGSNLRFPYNRADYFIGQSSTNKPAVCSPSTNVGVLYKMLVNHGDGKLSAIPLLDCVADMQIVLGWDLMNGPVAGTDGIIDTWSNANGTVAAQYDPSRDMASAAQVQTALLDPALIRSSLKLIKVYILAQDGRRDPGYTAPATVVVGDVGESALTKTYDLTGADMRNYRWKVYRIVTRPKNLVSNQ